MTTLEEHVPGTVHLVDLHGTMAAQHADNDEIILIPPPSDDPADPLNWSRKRKMLSTFCSMLYTFWVASGVGATPTILTQVSSATGLTINELTVGVGYMFLTFGWGCLVFQPLAQQYGKRPVYLFSILGTVGILIWHAKVKTNGEFIAIKLLQGLLGAPCESLSEISLTDIYFQHERGTYIALYGLILYSGIYFMTVIAGFINDSMGWQWVLYWCAILNAAAFVFLFFFMEETNYERKGAAEAVEGTDSTVMPDASDFNATPTATNLSMEKRTSAVELPTLEVDRYPQRTLLQKMSLVRTIDLIKPNRLVTFIMRPLEFLTYPVIFYSGFCYGCVVVWWTVLINTASPILSGAPYYFSATSVGLAYFSVWIGTVLAWYGIGKFGDKFLLWMAARNGGVSEPEHRQWLNAINLLLLPGSLLLWGVGSAQGIHWFGPVFAMALTGAFIIIGLQLSISYSLDSYKDFGSEALVTVIIIRNTINFAVAYGLTPWIDGMGRQNAFILATFVGMAQVATFIPTLYVGKWFRRRSIPRYKKHMEQIKSEGTLH